MKVKGNCSLVTKCTGGLGGKGGEGEIDCRFKNQKENSVKRDAEILALDGRCLVIFFK